MRDNVLLLEYDPRGTDSLNAKDIDITKVHEHHWQTSNPVTTEALLQLTLGAPQIMYNGGLLHALWSKNSCGLSVVVLQKAAQPLFAAHFASARTAQLISCGKQQKVIFALMVSLSMEVLSEHC